MYSLPGVIVLVLFTLTVKSQNTSVEESTGCILKFCKHIVEQTKIDELEKKRSEMGGNISQLSSTLNRQTNYINELDEKVTSLLRENDFLKTGLSNLLRSFDMLNKTSTEFQLTVEPSIETLQSDVSYLMEKITIFGSANTEIRETQEGIDFRFRQLMANITGKEDGQLLRPLVSDYNDLYVDEMAQSMCQSTAGNGYRVFAVRRPCGKKTCNQICTSATLVPTVPSYFPQPFSCLGAFHIYHRSAQRLPSVVGKSYSDWTWGTMGLASLGYGRAGCAHAACGANFCCCKSS